jgi:hypothetical protein
LAPTFFLLVLGLCRLSRLRELFCWCAGGLLPEPLGRVHVGTLVYVHAETEIALLDARGFQGTKEEPDQPRVAVDEDSH